MDIGADEFHPRLYCLEPIDPGSIVNIRFIGTPGAWVWFVHGSGVLDPPIQTSYGDLFMQQPFLNSWVPGDLSFEGTLVYPTRVPFHWQPGEEYHYQALIGPKGGSPAVLTNMVTARVE